MVGVFICSKTLNYDGINFFDCTNCTKADVNTNFLYNALTRPVSYQDLEGNEENFTILQRWADVVGAVFENGGKYTCSHNYSEYYGKNHHSDSSEQCYVADVLSKPKSVTHANKKYDNYHSTGLSMAGSFNELREKMCDEISDRIFRYALEPEDILDQGKYCPDALPELSDETPRDILYNIVTSNAADLTYTVPAHTIVNVEQSVSKDSMTVSYDVPIALTFKVVIFSMSGDVYCDDMFTCALSTAGYPFS